MDKISVIVPVFNAEKTLERCVNSIINQTYSKFEIILVDDGSLDNSLKICDKYKKQDSRIKVIHQENGGVSKTRNVGLANATGEWILFVDSDDLIDRELCKKVYDCAIENKSDIVMFGFSKFREGEEVKSDLDAGECRMLSKDEAMRLLSDPDIGNYSCNKLFKRELFKDIYYPEGRVYEDLATTYKIVDRSSKVCLLGTKLYYYYQSDDSITHTITRKHVTDEFEQRFEQYNFLIEHNYDAAKFVREELLADALQYCIYCPYEPNNSTYKNASNVILGSKNVKQIFGETYKIMYKIYLISVPLFNLVCCLLKKRLKV